MRTYLHTHYTYIHKHTHVHNTHIHIYSVTSVHERPCSRTIRFTNKFSEQKRLGWRTVYRIRNTQAGNNGKLATEAGWEYGCGSVSCLLTNLVSVYEHFGSRTASRNELSSWTEVPLYIHRCMHAYIHRYTHYFFAWLNSPMWAGASSLSRVQEHSIRHKLFGSNPPDNWLARRRALDFTKHSHPRSCRICTQNLSKRAVSGPCSRLHLHQIARYT
jgi:hypothetical protein